MNDKVKVFFAGSASSLVMSFLAAYFFCDILTTAHFTAFIVLMWLGIAELNP